MLRKIRQRIGQSTLEYAVLAVVVIGALLSIQTYLKRGIMGKVKSSTDDISSEQYDPNATDYSKTTTTISNTSEIKNAGTTTTEMLTPEETTVNMTSKTTQDIQ